MAYDFGLGSLFGAGAGFLGGGKYKDPSKAAFPYLNQIPGILANTASPYSSAGVGALPTLQSQFGGLSQDPGARLNQIGAGYHESPGYNFAVQQAMQAARNAAASQGLAGSPQHEQQSAQLASNLANQDYNNWLQQALGLYGTGLSGEQNIYGIGAKAGIGLGQDIGNVLGTEAQYAYGGAAGRNQGQAQQRQNLFGTLGAFLPYLAG